MNVVRLWPRGRPRHPDILTPAEWRVVAALRDGDSNAAVAAKLGVSVNTVRTHVSHILAKLELANRRALAVLNLEVSIAPPSTVIRYRCSFCRKNEHDVELLLAGPAGVYICGECIVSCNRVIAEHRSKAG